MTFAKGDRVKVEFEGVVEDAFEEENVYDIAYNGSFGMFPGEVLTKIEKVYPAGSVWVWRLPDGSVDTGRPIKAYTVTEFCSVYSSASAGNIIAIHEPE